MECGVENRDSKADNLGHKWSLGAVLPADEFTGHFRKIDEEERTRLNAGETAGPDKRAAASSGGGSRR